MEKKQVKFAIFIVNQAIKIINYTSHLSNGVKSLHPYFSTQPIQYAEAVGIFV